MAVATSFDEDELSTSSSELENGNRLVGKAPPTKRIIQSESEYSESDSLDESSDEYNDDDDDEEDYDEDEISSEEEEAWNARRKKRNGKANGKQTSRMRPRQAVSQTKRKKTKQEEYEGVTDSETEDFDSETSDHNYGGKKKVMQENNDYAEIHFLGEHKGKQVDSILEYNSEDDTFLVKWKHYSYREASWEGETDMAEYGVAVARKMQNAMERSRLISEDDLEEDRERRQQYCEPERVIDMTKRGLATWYLVKWRSLPYRECTWESEDVLFPTYQNVVDAYLNRSMIRRPAFKKPRQFIKITKEDPICTSVTEQDRLRDYQIDGVNWLTFSWFKSVNVILADEMGLGKTIQSVVFLHALREKYQFCGPSMVVVPLSTIDAWQREFTRWSPTMNVVVYNGDADSRRFIRRYEFGSVDCGNKIAEECIFDVLLTTYELVLKDKDDLTRIKWRQLIVDEGHRLKNNESLLFEALNYLIPTHHRLLITGTPLQNSLKELWCLLNFLDPLKYDDYLIFHERYAPPDDGTVETPQQAETRTTALHAILKPHLLRRMKKDVEQSLPAKREQILRIDLSPQQKDFYRLVLAKNYVELQRHHRSSSANLVNILGELKKICNHPICFTGDSPSDYPIEDMLNKSSKLALLDGLMTRLIKAGHRALIFSQSVKMLDVLEAYLSARRWPHQRIDGGVPSEARRRAIDAFNAASSPDLVFLLSTRAGGLGINLETADTVIIYDSDWNPQNDLQAMARAHRIGQRRPVMIYRLVTSGTVEETILERAKQKMVLDHLVIQRMQPNGNNGHHNNSGGGGGNGNGNDDLQAILKFGAKSLFQSDSSTPSTSGSNQLIDLDAILERAQLTPTTNTNTSSDFLGQFHVADVGKLPAWEEIIPEADRRKAEAEAAEQALMAKEGPLQEAILTTSRARKTRNASSFVSVGASASIGGVGGKSDRVAFTEAVKTGILSDDLIGKIAGKTDDYIIDGIRVGLLKSRQSTRQSITRYFNTHPANPAFRLDVKVKTPAKWTCKWGPRDDAMLLVGVHRHGFQWDKIKSDADLQLPYTLQRGTTPQSTHLQRRIEYLVTLLESSVTDTLPSQDTATLNSTANVDNRLVKQSLKPVKRDVEFINNLSADQMDDQLPAICEAVRSIGRQINSSSVPRAIRERCWQAVADIWPTDISVTDLIALHSKLQK